MTAKAEKKTDVWMPLWIGAYLADTMKLTTIQHGAYFLLLIAYWRERKPLADVDDELRSITKLERAEWRRNKPVLAQFFRVGDGVWWHKRVEAEIAIADGRRDQSSSGGGARWESDDDAATRGRHLRSKRLSEAREKGTHTAMEWACMKTFHGMRCVRCDAEGELVKDHILPIYQGGSDAIENIQPLCRKCNASKGPEDIDHRKDGWKNAIEEGIKRLLDACPTPSPTPLPSVGSEANASAAGAAAGDGDKSEKPDKTPEEIALTAAKSDLWKAAVAVLQAGGCAVESVCRSFMGKLVGDYDFEIVRQAVAAAATTQPADAREYLKATCMRLKGERGADHGKPKTVVTETIAEYQARMTAIRIAEEAEKAASMASKAARDAANARIKGPSKEAA